MLHRALPSTTRKPLLRATLVAAICLASASASAAERPRIAVAVERAGELSLPREFGEGAGSRALAQGVREACLEPGTLLPRAKKVECTTLRDVPDAQICVDETVERALTLEIKCDGAGATAEPVDLSRSGCDAVDCFAVEAKHAGATDLVVVRAVWKDGLSLTGVVTNIATGRSRTITAVDLERTYNAEWPRSGSQVLALLKWFSRRLTIEILGERARATATVSSSDGRRPVLVAPAAPVPSAPPSHSRRWIGWTLVVGGAAAGIGAGIIWNKDKDAAGCVPVAGDGDPCRELHRTIVPAVVLGAGAVVALVAGSIVLLSGRDGEPRLALSVQPSAVLLGGRF